VSRNLSDLLKKSLTPGQLDLIKLVAGEAGKLGYPLYIVGGIVRDLLLGRAGFDFDLVVEGDAPSLAKVLEQKYGGKATIHSKFRTAKWDIKATRRENQRSLIKPDLQLLEFNFLDLVSARSETYKHPGSLPIVKMGTIEDDLQRRDLTINALAIRVDGEDFGDLLDDHGGAIDVEKGSVRVLHPHSFLDDPTRMYRAVRYEQRLGFKIDDATLKLIPEARSIVEKLSAQRIRHELDLILDEPKAPQILERLADLELLKSIHPALPWDDNIKRRFLAKRNTERVDRTLLDLLNGETENRIVIWCLWLMSLNEKQLDLLNKRLHFTAATLEALKASAKIFAKFDTLAKWKASKCAEYLDDLPISAIVAAYFASSEVKHRHPLEQYLKVWRHIKPKTTGHDLKRLGLKPGPKYQIILRELRNAWIDQEIHSEGEENRYLERLLGKS
jgi:tRNA nucleotidyltransferase (CCA-adding enzyme)